MLKMKNAVHKKIINSINKIIKHRLELTSDHHGQSYISQANKLYVHISSIIAICWDGNQIALMAPVVNHQTMFTIRLHEGVRPTVLSHHHETDMSAACKKYPIQKYNIETELSTRTVLNFSLSIMAGFSSYKPTQNKKNRPFCFTIIYFHGNTWHKS